MATAAYPLSLGTRSRLWSLEGSGTQPSPPSPTFASSDPLRGERRHYLSSNQPRSASPANSVLVLALSCPATLADRASTGHYKAAIASVGGVGFTASRAALHGDSVFLPPAHSPPPPPVYWAFSCC
ncbi:hypothetical protein LIER_21968 [Lithospermum erythrorhizon]|uniref:Uncharacterized protein n=1 Tax=Lithospermum erythrorhizon TaxID=34254 RepID=A0AAV3QXT7_LITER